MNFTFRWIVLILFAAGGIGLAVFFATTLKPRSPQGPPAVAAVEPKPSPVIKPVHEALFRDPIHKQAAPIVSDQKIAPLPAAPAAEPDDSWDRVPLTLAMKTSLNESIPAASAAPAFQRREPAKSAPAAATALLQAPADAPYQASEPPQAEPSSAPTLQITPPAAVAPVAPSPFDMTDPPSPAAPSRGAEKIDFQKTPLDYHSPEIPPAPTIPLAVAPAPDTAIPSVPESAGAAVAETAPAASAAGLNANGVEPVHAADAHAEEKIPLLAAAPAAPAPGPRASKPAPREAAKGPKNDRNRIARVPGEGDDRLAIHIQDMDIREVLELLSEQGGINILASNSVQGKVSASLNDVDIDTALAAILRSTGYSSRRDGQFIYVGTQQDFQTLEQNLDRIATRIYRPNYVRAADIQHLITPLLTQGVGTISVSAQAEAGIAPDSNKAGGDAFAGGETVLVKDYEAILAQVDQVVAEVDKRPLQVHIEAMIMSVKLDDEYSMGVDFSVLRDKAHVQLASGSPLSDLGQVSFADGGLKFGFLDSSLGLFVSALETFGDTNVIATPRLLCLNKQRSEILIGAQLGYVSTTVTETSTSQKVDFLEIGTQLRIRPFISSDGMIRMEVHPELSTGSVQLKGNFTLPEKDVTQVTTNIMARDGSTVVIGGLMRNDLISSGTQIPLLGSLPGIGPLFRQKHESTQRSEVIVLITPHIVYDEIGCEGAQTACEFQRRQSVYADEMSPIGKRYLGRKFYRLAQQAFAEGDSKRALRFIDLSIHFDPLSRPAIDLRADIWSGNHSGPYTTPHVIPVSAAQPYQGQALPGWLLNDLGGAPLPPGTGAIHPRDPGVPGAMIPVEKPQHLH
ncbi:MAG TPA: secretin and TonB N-terminal domain-containing protein [Pirellulales bacterium]|jgi:type IV pilus assembly protein PilQ|nr:secretin and TonB N-terminal domain-containing protein [Pirellulales bacterium]